MDLLNCHLERVSASQWILPAVPNQPRNNQFGRRENCSKWIYDPLISIKFPFQPHWYVLSQDHYSIRSYVKDLATINCRVTSVVTGFSISRLDLENPSSNLFTLIPRQSFKLNDGQFQASTLLTWRGDATRLWPRNYCSRIEIEKQLQCNL